MGLARLLFLLSITAPLLAACGSGGGSGRGSGDGGAPLPPPSYGMLKPVSADEELGNALREGLSNAGFVSSANELFVIGDALEAAADAGSEADPGFSTTNLQEAGVDEADTVKYDGEILYVLDRSSSYLPQPELTEEDAEAGIIAPRPRSLIRMFRTDPAVPAVQELSQIELPEEDFSGGLYLHETADSRQLIRVGQESDLFYWGLMAVDYYWQGRHTRVAAWDVNDPENPVESWSLEFEGSMLASRRIDDVLYLVTRYTPSIDGLQPYPQTGEEIAANQALIEEAQLSALLPDVVQDGGPPQELLSASDCYVPNPEFDGGPLPPPGGGVVVVTAINLNSPGQWNAVCLNSFVSGFYASRNSLYLTANGSDNTTLIHKVRLTEGQPEYRGSGEVDGYIGTGNPSFLMSESGDDLRVVSSTWDDNVFPLPVVELEADNSAEEEAPEQDFGRHRLTILQESSDGTRLELLAQLPNAERPAHLGKPGEDLYAARFLGDRAYLVTFEVIDPFYVVDLTVPEDPRISGELELPGFSTLLQPLGDELVLGIGSEVPADGLALTQGVKVSLFNVADLDNPVELGTEIIGRRGSYSPAMHDHHALTLLETQDGYRAAIPVQRHEYLHPDTQENDPWTWYDWSDSGLYQFEINPASGELALSGKLITEQRSEDKPWPQYNLYGSRSVIHGDAVFFVQLPDVWSSAWGQQE